MMSIVYEVLPVRGSEAVFFLCINDRTGDSSQLMFPKGGTSRGFSSFQRFMNQKNYIVFFY